MIMLATSSVSVQRSIRAVARVTASLEVSQTVLLVSGPLAQSGKAYPDTDEVATAMTVRKAKRPRRFWDIELMSCSKVHVCHGLTLLSVHKLPFS